MDTTMELDELKHAWQALGRQLERQEAIQWQLLRERKLERVRHGLRPLVWGQVLQMLLGLGLIALGVAGWLATYALAWLVRRRARRAGREGGLVEDSGAIRRGRALLDEIAEFERG